MQRPGDGTPVPLYRSPVPRLRSASEAPQKCVTRGTTAAARESIFNGPWGLAVGVSRRLLLVGSENVCLRVLPSGELDMVEGAGHAFALTARSLFFSTIVMGIRRMRDRSDGRSKSGGASAPVVCGSFVFRREMRRGQCRCARSIRRDG